MIIRKNKKQNLKDKNLLKNSENSVINLNDLSSEVRNIIKNTISVKDKNLKYIMIPRVDIFMVHIDTTYTELLKVFNKFQHSRIPVYKDGIDDIVGVLYVKDLVGITKKEFSLKRILHKPEFVPISVSPMKLLHKFLEERVHMAMIVDEYGGLCGIVTMEDILEEIVGEINDEFDDKPDSGFKDCGDGDFLLDARMKVEDFNANPKLPTLPPDNADTVGGFLFSYLGRLPKRHEIIEYKSHIFTVVGKRGNIVTKIKMEKKEHRHNSKEDKQQPT